MATALCHLSLQWQPYRLFPYERALGLRELQHLLEPSYVTATDTTVELRTRKPEAAEQLTYFASFQNHSFGGQTRQAALEHAISPARAGRRQVTRYSVHGLHEYKGKFNPQTAKVLLNILGIKRGGAVLDPFCGSGTTVVECLHHGYAGFGIDVNPLAVFITEAKLSALSIHPDELRKFADRIQRQADWRRLPGSDCRRTHYLRSWFPPGALAYLENVRRFALLLPAPVGTVVLALASNLLRDYSLQEPADLRIRRRKSPMPSVPLKDALHDSILALADQLTRLRPLIPHGIRGGRAIVGDAEHVRPELFGRGEPFDAAICSPPYATALPYVDTHRLSLVWLGMAEPQILRQLEGRLIGNRECSERERVQWRQALETNAENLPARPARMCRTLQRALGTNDGFRRAAVPGLLYRYLVRMRQTFLAVRHSVKRGAPFALVVGYNRTTLGGEEFVIKTPELLAAIASECSFSVEEQTPLQAYQRYGLHCKNSISAESLLVLRAR